MPIAGFDPSITHFGWVIMNEEKTGPEALLSFGTFTTKPSDGLLVERLILQQKRVYELLKENNIKFISMEAPYWQDWSTEMLFALNQFLHEVFFSLGTFVLYIPPIVLKKIAVPGIQLSEITKYHIVHAAKTELNKHGKRFSEHVSDAYFAGKIGCRFYQWYVCRKLKDSDLTKDEYNLFCGKHTFKRGPKKGLTEYTGIIYKENEQFFDYSKKMKVKVIECLKKF